VNPHVCVYCGVDGSVPSCRKTGRSYLATVILRPVPNEDRDGMAFYRCSVNVVLGVQQDKRQKLAKSDFCNTHLMPRTIYFYKLELQQQHNETFKFKKQWYKLAPFLLSSCSPSIYFFHDAAMYLSTVYGDTS
jgi:hypothetical protein